MPGFSRDRFQMVTFSISLKSSLRLHLFLFIPFNRGGNFILLICFRPVRLDLDEFQSLKTTRDGGERKKKEGIFGECYNSVKIPAGRESRLSAPLPFFSLLGICGQPSSNHPPLFSSTCRVKSSLFHSLSLGNVPFNKYVIFHSNRSTCYSAHFIFSNFEVPIMFRTWI